MMLFTNGGRRLFRNSCWMSLRNRCSQNIILLDPNVMSRACLKLVQRYTTRTTSWDAGKHLRQIPNKQTNVLDCQLFQTKLFETYIQHQNADYVSALLQTECVRF